MIVVCNTSPICYLILINQINLLPQLFGEIIIPIAVQNELVSEGGLVQSYLFNQPDWLKIQLIETKPDTWELGKLDLGETEAILLAENLQADLIILDDLKARRVATNRGLKVTGLLAILFDAGMADLADFPRVVEELKQTSFRASDHLIERFLNRYYQQKSLIN